jgi:hypothetical protein
VPAWNYWKVRQLELVLYFCKWFISVSGRSKADVPLSILQLGSKSRNNIVSLEKHTSLGQLSSVKHVKLKHKRNLTDMILTSKSELPFHHVARRSLLVVTLLEGSGKIMVTFLPKDLTLYRFLWCVCQSNVLKEYWCENTGYKAK